MATTKRAGSARTNGHKRRLPYGSVEDIKLLDGSDLPYLLGEKREPPKQPGINAEDPDGESVPIRIGVPMRGVDVRRMRPPRWAWQHRLQIGKLNLLLGEEGGYKGTLVAWIAARITRGELAGDYLGTPMDVWIIGDEDDFEEEWVPRLYVAGADLSRIQTVDEDELESAEITLDFLEESVRWSAEDGRPVGLIVFDQLLDQIEGGDGGSAIYNPKHIRSQLMPIKHAARRTGVAVLGLLHPIKGEGKTFREMLAGSHAFNAVSRSSLWLVPNPDDPKRRVLVAGKPPNHGPTPPSFEFRPAVEEFDYNGMTFAPTTVSEWRDGKHTRETVLAAKMVAGEAAKDEAREQRKAAAVEDEKNRAAVLKRIPVEGSGASGVSSTGLATLMHGSGIGTERAKAIFQRLIAQGAVIETGKRNGHPVYHAAKATDG